MTLLMARTLLWNLFQTHCGAMSINTDICELLVLRKKRQTVTFSRRHKIVSIYFMLERKSVSDSQISEVFDDILFD